MPNFLKIHPVAAQFFLADGRTDRHDQANSHFSQFCESASKFKHHRAEKFENSFWYIIDFNA